MARLPGRFVPGSKNTSRVILLLFLSIAKQWAVTNINPHNVKVLSYENDTIKRRFKEAIAFKQRNSPWIMDEGLEVPKIYIPLLGILSFSVMQQVLPDNSDELSD